MAIHSLHIGINNYRGTGSDLAGCVNDARDLLALVGPKAASSALLLDAKATRAGMLAALKLLLVRLGPGDLGFITFSGHGTYVADKNGDEPDRQDEALVCADLQLIIDDEFRGLLSARHRQSRLIVITDSCHSGSVHRGVDLRGVYAKLAVSSGVQPGKPRFLPPGNLTAMTRQAAETRRRADVPRVGREQLALPLVAHFAGCRDDQFSFDARFDDRPNGAFTHYLLEARRSLPPHAELGDWFDEVAQLVRESDFQQTPVLNASAAVRRWAMPF